MAAQKLKNAVAMVELFCHEIGVKLSVLNVWTLLRRDSPSAPTAAALPSALECASLRSGLPCGLHGRCQTAGDAVRSVTSVG